jgi:hypothetical protein
MPREKKKSLEPKGRIKPTYSLTFTLSDCKHTIFVYWNERGVLIMAAY